MFNLEQSISDWRRQMLAAGIQSPVPLEELESHLREEIEGQIKLGMSEQQAFEATVLQIGRSQELQTEFAKERGWQDWLRGNMSKRARLVLWCWIGFCLIEFTRVCEDHAHSSAAWFTGALFIISLVIIAVTANGAGVLWSSFLFRSTKQVRRIISVIAACGIFLLLVPMFIFIKSPVHDMLDVPFYFGVFTIVLLNSPPAETQKATN